MRQLGRFMALHPRRLPVATAVVPAVAAPLGASVIEHLSTGGFDDPASQATVAARRIRGILRVSDPDDPLARRRRSTRSDRFGTKGMIL